MSSTGVPTTIVPSARRPITGEAADPLWYRNAVIYQMHVRSFCDSNGDGIGDFNGAISKLDYLDELGVTAVWLLPFYPSPLRDDGYDIADYTGVNPMYGSIEDLKRFIEEAHRRQIRVITELVINHTSDQHQWFQRARHAPKGSPERDFYVWSDDPKKYAGVRVIFQDFEPSNWTLDPVAGQYFWHRFFNHQPDLNFDNPAVHQAVFDTLDFWMKLGVDGLRLDAVPYLYEREDTSCENLPETHAFLKKLRTHIDTKWPGRMLLAEANQWPEDAAAYFGDGDECHMNFHFPLMPRLFMSVRMEDRFPIIDILEQTPPIPTNAQWAMFLRNHDELTLEMVTDEERDYMWRVYASDPAARINLGIRRRLAPLLDNDRRKIELMNALLFSMPGTPILYYGDEIGMGDNIFLGDRNGVRTPMQWSGDRNAGFSRANPQRLFLPVIIDPEYNYETVNVESQASNVSSLLWWMRRLIALRKQYAVFGTGEVVFLTLDNPRILAFVRRNDEQQVLVVANLSRFAQPVELNLAEFAGATPVEMFGNVQFPVIPPDGKYTLSVGPHGFFWFRLDAAAATAGPSQVVPVVRLRGQGDVLSNRNALHRTIEAALPQVLPRQRWFVSKARSIRHVSVVEHLPLGPLAEPYRAVLMVSIDFNEGESETYALPLQFRRVDDSDENLVGALLVIQEVQGDRWVMQDGMSDPVFAQSLLQIAMDEKTVDGSRVRLFGRRLDRNPALSEWSHLTPKISTAEQSNSNVIFGDKLIFKLYRRMGEGVNPELEIGEHLNRVGFAHTAPLVSAIEATLNGARRTLAVTLDFVPNQGDAWATFLDHAKRFYEALDALTDDEAGRLCLPGDSGCAEDHAQPPAEIASLIAAPLELARLLGQRTAEMHAALAEDLQDPAFVPVPYSAAYQRSLFQSMRNTTRNTLQVLSTRSHVLQGETAVLAKKLLERREAILETFRHLTSMPVRSPRIRCHGDYHLGQVLWTGKDFLIIDFEGEPLRSMGERRLKRSPMKDVAGMVRSFDYAAWTALRQHWNVLQPEPHTADRDRHGAAVWGRWMSREFVRSYTQHLRTNQPGLLPAKTQDAEIVLKSWSLEKALYEVAYELNSRPDWVDIPIRAVLDLIDNQPGTLPLVKGTK